MFFNGWGLSEMKHILLGLCATLLASTSSFAADAYQPEPITLIEAPEIQVSEASGWYLRGDVGYSLNKLRGVEFYQGGSSADLKDFHTAKLGNAFMGGVGVGYQVNNMLRTDLTFDYMGSAKFKGSTKGDGASSGACQNPCTSSDYASMKAFALMANAYVDLATYGRFTPYIGAGIGGAYVNWGNLSNTSCPDAGGACDATVIHRGKGGWRFSYALMAGASIDVTCNLKADVGYRMRYINGGDMFGFASNGGPGRDKGLYSHEARVGARYNFNGCDTAQLMEPADIPLQPAVYK